MKLKDVLDQYHGDKNIMIEVRCNSPLDDEDDMLFGWCMYDPAVQEIVMSHYDDYSLDMEIDRHQTTDGRLVVWISIEWSSGRKLKTMLNNKTATVKEGEST